MMTDDDIFRMYVKYRLNSIYGSGSCHDCSVQVENKRLKAENESLKTELQKFEKMKRSLYLLYLLFEDEYDADDSSPKEEKRNECKTEVQEAKEEDRATRESKDTN